MAGGGIGGGKGPVVIQLTSLIDVVSILIIFLVFGDFFGAKEVTPPWHLTLPQSLSQEAINIAPELYIKSNKFSFSLLPGKDFSTTDVLSIADNPGHVLKQTSSTYIKKLPENQKGSGVLLNIVADKTLPYEIFFNVIKTFRQLGFTTLLFVAEGEKK